MSRVWTARKTSTFVPAAVAAGASAPYPLSRAGPPPAAATKQALRLLVGYTLLFLPLHAGVCYFAARSPGLAVVAVPAAAVVLLTVALARWLQLDDLLQKLPLVLAVGLVGVGLVFVSSLSVPRGLAGMDFFGGLFILIAVVSVLGSLYKPLAVTYQAVTMKTPFRDLCVAAGALLASLALALVAHALPQFVLGLYSWAVCGGYAGLVVTEYAAWARSSPGVSLELRMRFEAASPRRKEPDVVGAALGAAAFGAGLGVLAAFGSNVPSPSPDFVRFAHAVAREPEGVREVLAVMPPLGLVGVVFGFLKAGHSLGTMVPGNPLAAARFGWQALVVFLTYPEVEHPLVHQLRVRWLRPPAVRAALTCAALATVATALVAPADKPRDAQAEKSAASPPAVPPPPTLPRTIPPGDLELARITGEPPELWLGPQFAPRPAVPAPAAPAQAAKPEDAGAVGLGGWVLGLVVLPPLALAVMVFYVGLHVLPAYGGFFETPEPPKSK
ncbi:MAG: hypothetical protein K2X82_04645 [Gemmataceae bacterium]|nr:hypothetical protein [Gemmataceae bacterium]